MEIYYIICCHIYTMALIKPRVQHALADPEKDKKDLVDALEWMQYQLGSCKPLVLYAYQHVYGLGAEFG